MDASLAGQLEGLFLADLASSSEIVLPGSRSIHTVAQAEPLPTLSEIPRTSLEPEGGLTQRLEALMDTGGTTRPWRLAHFMRAGASFGGALAGHRTLGPEDRTILGTVSVMAISAAAIVGFFPRAFGWAGAFVLLWLGVVTGVRAIWHRMRARYVAAEGADDMASEPIESGITRKTDDRIG